MRTVTVRREDEVTNKVPEIEMMMIRRRTQLGNRGATIFDLMGVIAIAGALAVAAVNSLDTVTSAYRMRGAARRLFSHLQRARASAVTENNRYIFACNDRTQYSICDDENRDRTCNPGEQTIVALLDDTARVQFSAICSSVQFLTDGTASAPLTLTLVGSRGESARVEVGAAGRVRIL